MFQAYWCSEQAHGMMVTVYSVDFNHDAFLIGYNRRFQWAPMNEFKPVI